MTGAQHMTVRGAAPIILVPPVSSFSIALSLETGAALNLSEGEQA